MIKEICERSFEIINGKVPRNTGFRKPLSKVYLVVEKLVKMLPSVNNIDDIKMKFCGSHTYLHFPDKIKLVFPGNQSLADFENIPHYFNQQKLSEGNIVVDAGAYVGVFALYAGKKVGKSGKVIAFEPEPRNYGNLCRNISLNNLEEVIIPIKRGLWSSNGVRGSRPSVPRTR